MNGGGEAAAKEAGAEPAAIPGTPAGGLADWVAEIRRGIADLPARAGAEPGEAQRRALDLYIGRQEYIELYYGPGGRLTSGEALGPAVKEAEARFHELMRMLGAAPAADSARVAAAVEALVAQLDRVVEEARAAGVSLAPSSAGVPPEPERVEAAAAPVAAAEPVRTAEVHAIVEELRAAERAYLGGDFGRAQAGVDRAYLEGIELLEERLPSALAGRIERLVHLSLRPQLRDGASADRVRASFASLYAELGRADAALHAGGTFWFGAVNAFVIIVREGLEAVLLIGALIGYLGATGASRRHHRQIYAGVVLGVLASLATWVAARTLIPIGGASRELIEGFTALAAVGVLLYVAHWLFHKAYVHEWKEYLRDRLGRAVSTGSAFAMASLAFAAVYREGFETILFYQALRFDVGSGAVLAGFAPGALLILGVGVAIIRLGLKLPLRRLFNVTNAILLYLAFVFLGKGMYDLQEAGMFTPRPLAWAPDHEVLRLVLGFYPIAETALAQAALLGLVLATYVVYRRSLETKRAAAPVRTAVPAD